MKGWSWRRRILAVLAAGVVLLSVDLLRPPERQWSARALLATIGLYQETLSPLMPAAGVQCRFTPTCSHYGEEAIRKYGALGGTARTAWRVLRCGPWTEAGTEDHP